MDHRDSAKAEVSYFGRLRTSAVQKSAASAIPCEQGIPQQLLEISFA
jgi:hypothetical protein